MNPLRCPKCGTVIRTKTAARALGARGGAAGRGAAKRRDTDYAALARKAAAARVRNRKAAG